MHWAHFNDGNTLGTTGREGGVIQVDEEYDGAARILLEEGCLRAPYAITASLYGYLLHTRFVADDETAQYAMDDMKSALVTMLGLIPDESDRDEVEKLNALEAAIDTFRQQFP